MADFIVGFQYSDDVSGLLSVVQPVDQIDIYEGVGDCSDGRQSDIPVR
jgi:hypothetical protein